jgi:hypothetical protein
MQTSTSERLAAHLRAVIEQTAVDANPFSHQVLSGPWPEDLYPRLLAALPTSDYYRPLHHSDARLPDGTSARLQFPLIDANIDRLPPPQRDLWREVIRALHSPAVIEAYRARFAPDLERLRGVPAGSIRLRPYTTLFRDIGGYRISIHPDSPRKAITTQFYLPADDSQRHLGTRFHSRAVDGSYSLERAMVFAPNTGYAFAVTPDSHHSVATLEPGDRPRDSLMIIINYDRGVLVEGVKSAQKQVRAWVDRHRGNRTAEAGEGRYES